MKNEDKLIYKELSYQIVGVLFDVFNEIGLGYDEKTYELAVAKDFSVRGLRFQRQISADLIFKGEIIGKYYLDFLVEDKIVLELKVGKRFSKRSFEQVSDYLRITNKQLAILAIFTRKGVNFTRVLNINNTITKSSIEIKLTNIRKLINF